jgi:uncharacterized protein YdaU (DUF1376 family)
VTKPRYIDWCAKNALDGVMNLSPIEELAYRRIMDMIYATDDDLEDNDEVLKWSTKAGSKWPKVKKRLLELRKIEVVDGRITNAVCREKLEESWARIAQSSHAGKISAEKRKQQKTLNTASTGVGTGVGAGVSTGEHTEEPTNHQSSRLDLKQSSLPPYSVDNLSPRQAGTNPRAMGTNPRAMGTNPRAAGNRTCDDEDFLNFRNEMGFDVMHHLTDKGIASAKSNAPGWDVYKLAADYSAAVRDGKLSPPKAADRAFPAWCRKITGGRRPA